jgi:ribosomal protein L7/L12
VSLLFLAQFLNNNSRHPHKTLNKFILINIDSLNIYHIFQFIFTLWDFVKIPAASSLTAAAAAAAAAAATAAESQPQSGVRWGPTVQSVECGV